MFHCLAFLFYVLLSDFAVYLKSDDLLLGVTVLMFFYVRPSDFAAYLKSDDFSLGVSVIIVGLCSEPLIQLSYYNHLAYSDSKANFLTVAGVKPGTTQS